MGRTLKPYKLTGSKIRGHDVLRELDPFVTESLVKLLEYQKYVVDPTLSKLSQTLPGINLISYRINSGKTWHPYGTCWIETYHEAFHNLVGLRFGTKLKNRPRTILLNESLGQGLYMYFMAKLSLTTDIDVREIENLGTQFIYNEAVLEKSFTKELERVKKDPFKSYKELVVESYETSLKFLSFLKKPDMPAARVVQIMRREIRKTKHLMFLCNADYSLPPFFVAANCGFESDSTDKRNEKECLKILEASSTMEEWLVNLGINKYIAKAS